MAKGRRKGSENQVGNRDIGFGKGVVPSSEMIGDLNLRDDLTLADKINMTTGRGRQRLFSGRGHGRVTAHGRGPKRGAEGPRSKKRDMLYFVRDFVREVRMYPPQSRDGFSFGTTHDLATILVNNTQFFDCDNIAEYLSLNWQNVYPDLTVPPHPDVILPADTVGLYFQDYGKSVGHVWESSAEVMFLCIPVSEGVSDERYKGRLFNVYSVTITETGGFVGPVGQVVNYEDDALFDLLAMQLVSQTEEEREASQVGLRLVASALQIINQPRFVVQGKRDVSLVKRQSFKKATGKFTPDSWNMVAWNVDKPVKAKHYEEGTGGRQALHFRRGHWRKAEEGWERSRWSETRNRWEQYIHGYEAGHPAFGVKKSYHLPRKEPV